MLSIHPRRKLAISVRRRRWLSRAAATAALGALALWQSPTPVASAQATAPGDVVIDINNPQRSKYPLAIPVSPLGDAATSRTIAEVANFDLKVAGWFRPIDTAGYTGNLPAEGMALDGDRWKELGAFGVIKYRPVVNGDRVKIDFALYELEKGDSPVLQRTYQGSTKDVRKLTHMWCNDVVKHFTGEDGFFGSKLTFVTRGRNRTKKVVAIDFDGANGYAVSRNRSINILPTWSPDGSKIAYTSYMRSNPDLYVAPAGGGRAKRISSHRGMNTGASYHPSGQKMLVTLSKDGQPEIYEIDANSGKILRRLTNNRYIDSGAVYSPDGKEIAFVSDREGGPQIFVMNADGSNQRRVSMNGSYNTTPDWNPRPGARQLAYTTRADATFDIVTLDLNTGKMVRITQNEGVNEAPAWAPNGRAIAFASHRKGGMGVYIANADGTGDAVRVWKGKGTSVDWGPTPKQ